MKLSTRKKEILTETDMFHEVLDETESTQYADFTGQLSTLIELGLEIPDPTHDERIHEEIVDRVESLAKLFDKFMDAWIDAESEWIDPF